MIDVIYISYPRTGDRKKDIETSKKYCCMTGVTELPIAPYLYFSQFLEEGYESFRGSFWSSKLMRCCQIIWIFGDELTESMIREIEEAKTLKLKMKFHNAEGKEITKSNYLIHSEIGPAYRRVMAEYFGDAFCFDICSCRGDCKAEGKSEEEKPEPPAAPPECKSAWRRFLEFFSA